MPAEPESRDAELHTGIVVDGVSKVFGGELALPTTSLRAPSGAVSLLIGRNGAGKTTMLRILATLVLPDTGTVRINGIDPVTDGQLVRTQIGLALVNERSIFWRLTVLENLALFARVRGVPKRERAAHCRDVLEVLGLAALEDRQAHALSAGQRQRVILGRALVGDPHVLLVDEPLRGLDADAEERVIGALQARADAGATVLIATPSMREYEPLNTPHVTEIQPVATSETVAHGSEDLA
ncbi:MAG: ABC transporter ATP-binding protein [Solirubrobacteraceae bacterium]|nr:ABC transporter ATP-binding protein [Patulibacter sp.]